MECICRVTCQIRVEDYSDEKGIRLFEEGAVHSFSKRPPHFEVVGQQAVNFLLASEAELLASGWKFTEAYEAILEFSKIELTKEEGTTKKDIVKQIMDIRYRKL